MHAQRADPLRAPDDQPDLGEDVPSPAQVVAVGVDVLEQRTDAGEEPVGDAVRRMVEFLASKAARPCSPAWHRLGRGLATSRSSGLEAGGPALPTQSVVDAFDGVCVSGQARTFALEQGPHAYGDFVLEQRQVCPGGSGCRDVGVCELPGEPRQDERLPAQCGALAPLGAAVVEESRDGACLPAVDVDWVELRWPVDRQVRAGHELSGGCFDEHARSTCCANSSIEVHSACK